ncbi:MAG: hypothetical protein H6825_04880 [Planctomycetes bacterium]|nr:hypothetical protein [Planctomycetota bacterium]
MSRTVPPTALLRMLESQLEELETGLVAVDAQVTLSDGVSVDLLARDTLGYPVIALVCDSDPHAAIGRMAAVAAALRRGQHLLARLYSGRGLDPTLRARFVLLSRRFPDDFAASLDLLAYEVRALEYRIVHDAAGKGRLDLFAYHRAGGTTRAARTPAPVDPAAIVVPRPARPVESPASRPSQRAAVGTPITPARENGRAPAVPSGEPAPAVASTATASRSDPLLDVEARPEDRALFVRARDSIRTLTKNLSEQAEPGRLTFLVGGRPLATLRLGAEGVCIDVGDGSRPALRVRDDTEYNLGLNAVFTHYFADLSPGR